MSDDVKVVDGNAIGMHQFFRGSDNQRIVWPSITTSRTEKEVLHDISFLLGAKWAGLTHEEVVFHATNVGGNSGLTNMAISWADEFHKTASFHESYNILVDKFFNEKWEAFVAAQIAKRMTK